MFPKSHSQEVFAIAEVGQNHQGDIEKALKYVDIFAAAGADAVKFQTRNNKYLFSKESYSKEYNSENAFATIYGEHREALELNKADLIRIKKACVANNVKFMSTPFDEPSLELLCNLEVDILKVASFDIGNLPFLDKIGKTKIPVVVSVGGGKTHQIKDSLTALEKYHANIAVLHCVSEYPCEYNRLGLDNIEDLIAFFPNLAVGSSDHFNGTLSGPIAYMKGARVFEKHVTLNRSWKGTDHSFALEPDGFRKFVRDIKRVEDMMKPKPEDELGNEPVFKKLGKSVSAARRIEAGELLTYDNLTGIIHSEIFTPVRDSNLLVGKRARRTIEPMRPIIQRDVTE